MLGNGMVGDTQYVAGQDYAVDTDTYRSLGTSCVLAAKRPRWLKQATKPIRVVDYRVKDAAPRNFLVIKSQGIGNVINITPTISKIHEMFPECKIDFMCDDSKKGMLAGWDAINRIFEYPADVEKVMEVKYDFALVGAPGQGDDVLMRSFSASSVLLPNQASLAEQHEVVVNMAPLVNLGWNGVDIADTFLPLSDADKRKARRDFPGRKYIAICAGFFPSVTWARKNWGYDKFARLVELLKDQYPGYQIIVMGAGDDGKVFDFLKSRARVIDAVGKYTINESGAILQRCKFLVSNDTGLAHVAGAVGCKVHVIFGPTSIIKNHPWRNSNVITLDLNCSPCQFTQRWGTCQELICMGIKPSEVMESVTHVRVTKPAHELAVIMANHDRYPLVLASLTSMLQAHGSDKVRFILIDDNSDMQTKRLLDDFARAQGNTQIIHHNFTYARDRYHETIKDGLEAASDCRYVMFAPDDGLYSPWLFDVVKKSLQYLQKQIKCLTFWKDDRSSGRGSETEGEYDRHFDILKYMDGFMVVFEREYLDGLEIHGRTMPGGSSIWWNIQLQMKSHSFKILGYKETLAEHLGGMKSSMHPQAVRDAQPIWARDLNIWRKPKILEEK